MLRPFFTRPAEFRSLLGERSGLILSHFAREVLTLSTVSASLLLILIKKAGLAKMARFLASDGYSSIEYNACTSNFPTDAAREDRSGSTTFSKTKYGRTWQLDLRWSNHSEGLLHYKLRRTLSTTELTFLTRNKGYCLFPKTSLQEKEVYRLQSLQKPSVQRCLAELAEQGFRPSNLAWTMT